MARDLHLLLLLLRLAGSLLCVLDDAPAADPMSSMVVGNGYPLETHTVTTADGYQLDMHRIPYGLKSPAAPNKPVVFVMHQLFSTSYSFVFLGKNNSLAFLLADAGYDVWLGNTRGNANARRNIHVPPSSPLFWQFSWHERAVLDLPAMFDHVLSTTQQPKLSYVSLALGGTMLFALLAEMPLYNAKVKVAFNMAPAVFITEPYTALQAILAQASRLVEWTAVFMGVNEFRLSPTVAEMLYVEQCKSQAGFERLCETMFFLAGGFHADRINKTKIPDIIKESSLGAAMKEMSHFGQQLASKRFAKYDYGFVENVVRYGSLLAPSYDLSQVTAPIVVINAQNDEVISQKDIDLLAAALPNPITRIFITEPGFRHVDFIVAEDANTIVYSKVLAELKKY